MMDGRAAAEIDTTVRTRTVQVRLTLRNQPGRGALARVTDDLSESGPSTLVADAADVETDTDERIRRAVLLLAGATGHTPSDLCQATGLGRSTIYTRLSEDPTRRRPFQPAELDALAALFEVDVAVFFHGVDVKPGHGRHRARLVPHVLARPWRGMLLPRQTGG